MSGYLGSPLYNSRMNRSENNINKLLADRGYYKNDQGKLIFQGGVPTALPGQDTCPKCECNYGKCSIKANFDSILDSNNNVGNEYLACDPYSLPTHCKNQALQSCSQCHTPTTTLTPEYQVTSTSASPGQGSGAGSSQGSGSGSGTGSSQGSGNFVTINIPDNLLTNQTKMNTIINSIETYLGTEDINVLNTYKHYENRGTTTEPITTSQSSQNSSFGSNNANNNQTSKQKVIELINNLTVEELKELMILMTDMDLDQTDSSSSNVFNVLDAVKRALMYNYNSTEEVENQLATHQVKSVAHLKNKLKQLDPETYKVLFGKDRTHKYNTTYIPGFQYTPPELWPLHQYKAPVCIQDKTQVSDPAFVFDKGTPANALDYESLRQLPEFVYYESQTRDESEAVQANKMIANLCQMKCSQNCDFPICKSLNCPNCNY